MFGIFKQTILSDIVGLLLLPDEYSLGFHGSVSLRHMRIFDLELDDLEPLEQAARIPAEGQLPQVQ